MDKSTSLISRGTLFHGLTDESDLHLVANDWKSMSLFVDRHCGFVSFELLVAAAENSSSCDKTIREIVNYWDFPWS